jgi:hypothetical protein
VQGGDVLQGHEDVPVQLDVGDVFDVAVRRQNSLLVLAPEEGDFDLFALVLVRVVLDDSEPSRMGLFSMAVVAVFAVNV